MGNVNSPQPQPVIQKKEIIETKKPVVIPINENDIFEKILDISNSLLSEYNNEFLKEDFCSKIALVYQKKLSNFNIKVLRSLYNNVNSTEIDNELLITLQYLPNNEERFTDFLNVFKDNLKENFWEKKIELNIQKLANDDIDIEKQNIISLIKFLPNYIKAKHVNNLLNSKENKQDLSVKVGGYIDKHTKILRGSGENNEEVEEEDNEDEEENNGLNNETRTYLKSLEGNNENPSENNEMLSINNFNKKRKERNEPMQNVSKNINNLNRNINSNKQKIDRFKKTNEKENKVNLSKSELYVKPEQVNRSNLMKPEQVNRSNFTKPEQANKSNFTKPEEANKSNFTKPEQVNRSNFGKPVSANKSNFGKPVSVNKSNFTKPIEVVIPPKIAQSEINSQVNKIISEKAQETNEKNMNDKFVNNLIKYSVPKGYKEPTAFCDNKEKCQLTKKELCLGIIENFIVRNNIIAAILTTIPYKNELGQYEGGICYQKFMNLLRCKICVPYDYRNLKNKNMNEIIKQILEKADDLEENRCRSNQGFFLKLSKKEIESLNKKASKATLENIKINSKLKYNLFFVEFTKKLKDTYFTNLNSLITILEKMKEMPLINNKTLNILSDETKNIIDNMYNLCHYYYIYAIISLINSDISEDIEKEDQLETIIAKALVK